MAHNDDVFGAPLSANGHLLVTAWFLVARLPLPPKIKHLAFRALCGLVSSGPASEAALASVNGVSTMTRHVDFLQAYKAPFARIQFCGKPCDYTTLSLPRLTSGSARSAGSDTYPEALN